MALQTMLDRAKELTKTQQVRVGAIMGALVADAAGERTCVYHQLRTPQTSNTTAMHLAPVS